MRIPFDPVLTLANLLDAETVPEDITIAILNTLNAKGFPVASWDPTFGMGTPRAIVEADAVELAKTNAVIAAISAAGFISIAIGNAPGLVPGDAGYGNQTWLDLCAWSAFREERREAVFGEYSVTVTVASGFGPYTIPPNGLWVADIDGAHRYQSTNEATVVVTSSTPLQLSVRAEQAGAGYNTIDAPGTPLELITVLLGAAVSTRDVGDGTSVIDTGDDIEDDEALRTRCIDKWAVLSHVMTADAMTFYARSAASVHGRVTGVYIDDSNPSGPGSVDLYIATVDGVPSDGLVADVDTVIQRKRPLAGTNFVVRKPTGDPLAVTGDVYVPSTMPVARAQAKADALFVALQKSLAVGDGFGDGVVRLSELAYLLRLASGPGAYAELTAPVADTIPPAKHVVMLPSPSVALAWHQL